MIDVEKVTHSRWLDREFLMNLAAQVIGVGVLVGVLGDQAAATEYANSIIEHLDKIIAAFGMIVSNGAFIISRGLAKRK